MVDDVFKSPAPTVQVSESMFDLGEISVPIPSKGRLYPTDHPLHGKESVMIRPMATPEENILATPALIKNGEVSDRLIVSCIRNKAINPSDLLIGDKNAILLGIRISGFGPEYLTMVTCPKCKKSYKAKFMLDKLELQELELPDGVVQIDDSNLFQVSLPLSGVTVTFKILSQKDQNDIDQGQKNREEVYLKKGITVPQVNTSNSDRLIKSIQSIGGKSDGSFIKKFVDVMRPKDSRYLKRLMSDIEPKVMMNQDSRCPSCQHVEVAKRVPLTIDFFWPEEIF